jgi:acyl-coenzyme A thioesterase PaaI-like protein
MDYEALAEGMAAAVPFNGHLGLEIRELGSGYAIVRLPDDQRLQNHVGSQHASGLFAAAEAASGGAFMAGFGERLAELRPLATRAEIAYSKLATGPIDARAELPDTDALLATLDADGKVVFDVPVTLTNGAGETVATATVEWHVRSEAKRSEAEPRRR